METVHMTCDEEDAPAPPARVLVVAPPGAGRDRLVGLVGAADGVEAVAADDHRAAGPLLAGGGVRLVLAAATAGGREVAREVRRHRRPVRVALIADAPTVDEVVAAVRDGAEEVLTDPPDPARVRKLVAAAAADVPVGPDRFYGVVSKSPKMHDILSLIRDIAPTGSTVLIQGETGTGKEQLARAVHAASLGRAGPFVAVNCAAVPENLLESELFGHEKGSFTGADRQRIGKFELAHEGTLFLDEVGDVPPLMQVKLLRVLQDRRFERVGGSDPIAVDVRVIAATNRPLRRMVKGGGFREDLYYRLNVIRIDVPPLRLRPEDIPPLVEHFCRKYARAGCPPKRMTPAALDRLAAYLWPGNVRELENAVERACVVHQGEAIEPGHLPPELGRTGGPGAVRLDRPLKDLIRETTAKLERRYIVKALRKTRGHVGRAAKLCGYCRRSLTAKIGEYGIDRLAFAGKG